MQAHYDVLANRHVHCLAEDFGKLAEDSPKKEVWWEAAAKLKFQKSFFLFF